MFMNWERWFPSTMHELNSSDHQLLQNETEQLKSTPQDKNSEWGGI